MELYCPIDKAYGCLFDSTYENKYDHEYHILQFNKLKNKKNTLNSFEIIEFNNALEHINNCESCKLYFKKNLVSSFKKTNEINIKKFLMNIILGILIILIIELILLINNNL